MKRRPQDEFIAQQDPFVVGDTYSTYIGDSTRRVKVTEITCPRRACGETFIVRRRRWEEASDLATRPCPFCFKVSLLP